MNQFDTSDTDSPKAVSIPLLILTGAGITVLARECAVRLLIRWLGCFSFSGS